VLIKRMSSVRALATVFGCRAYQGCGSRRREEYTSIIWAIVLYEMLDLRIPSNGWNFSLKKRCTSSNVELYFVTKRKTLLDPLKTKRSYRY
jgi:hypothetical protein